MCVVFVFGPNFLIQVLCVLTSLAIILQRKGGLVTLLCVCLCVQMSLLLGDISWYVIFVAFPGNTNLYYGHSGWVGDLFFHKSCKILKLV